MKVVSSCCTECPIFGKVEVKHVISGLAASILFLSQSSMVSILTIFSLLIPEAKVVLHICIWLI